MLLPDTASGGLALEETLDVEDLASIRAPEQPIFFMHIAKTAGSFLNARFKKAIGAEAMATHIENSIGDGATLSKKLESGVRFFSGHVMHSHWNDIATPTGVTFRKVTILRDPIEHLASHIQWLDHYNHQNYYKEYKQLDEAHRRLIDRIGAIDIADIGQLDAFLAGLSGLGVRLLDNCQARYFVASGRKTLDTIQPLTLTDRFAVAKAAAEFDAIVFQDDLEHGVAQIADVTGVAITHSSKRVNPALSDRSIDTTNPIIRQVLSRCTLVDQWLYRHMQARKAGVLADD